MQKIFTAVFILAVLFSCNSQESFVESRLRTADKFIECLKNNAPDRILDYTYPDVDHKINNKESRDFYVNKAYEFIKKFGLPPKNKWIIKFDPQNNFERLLITIPLFKGYDPEFNLLKANLVIAFPPPQISDKIYHYDIQDMYSMSPTKPPPDPRSIDTSGKEN